MDLNPSVMIATIINFFILVLILKHFFWDKIKNAIQEREEYIDEKLASADEESRKARLYLVENERILKSSKEEGKKIIEKRKEKANKIYNEIIDDANKEAKSIIERAKVEVDREKEKAQWELKNKVVDVAVELSVKALEEKVTEEKQRELISDFINKIGS